jgi:hypothetical protein
MSYNPILLKATITFTSAQIKAAHATPIIIVPAAGAGKVIVVVSAMGKYTYGGSNVFVAGAGQVLRLGYGIVSTLNNQVIPNAALVGTASSYSFVTNTSANQAAANIENNDLTLWNSSVTEITGNAANDNTGTCSVLYYVVSI